MTNEVYFILYWYAYDCMYWQWYECKLVKAKAN
jgi:hypothetical protein